jgi:hypothetical protein
MDTCAYMILINDGPHTTASWENQLRGEPARHKASPREILEPGLVPGLPQEKLSPMNAIYRWKTMVAVMVRTGVLLLAMAVLVSWPGSAAWAGGSCAREDLRPILHQEPVLAQWLTGGLEFAETGDARRIGQNVNPRFGGLRIGPYVILAKPKGASGPFTLEVTVETELRCRDAAGKDVDVSQAHTIEEKFSSVTVRPYQGRGPNTKLPSNK